MFGRVLLVPVEVEEYGRSDKQAREEHRADERGKEKGDDPGVDERGGLA